MKFMVFEKIFFALDFLFRKNKSVHKDILLHKNNKKLLYTDTNENDIFYKGDKMAKIKRIIIHCSDSNWADAEEIKKWHLAKSWSDIGYHYVILNGKRKSVKDYDKSCDGLIEAGRKLDNDIEIEGGEAGAHASGFNSDSIGICLVGIDTFTKEQIKSLLLICSFWKRLIPELEINGHYQFTTAKSCPNFKVDKLQEIIGKQVISTDSLEKLISSLSSSIKMS